MSRLGRAAYEAYSRASDHHSLVTNDPLPLWPELPEPIRLAWDAAATAVVAEAQIPLNP